MKFVAVVAVAALAMVPNVSFAQGAGGAGKGLVTQVRGKSLIVQVRAELTTIQCPGLVREGVDNNGRINPTLNLRRWKVARVPRDAASPSLSANHCVICRHEELPARQTLAQQ
jgi:hypothetical protein